MRLKTRFGQIFLTVLLVQILSWHKVSAEGEACNNAVNRSPGICINVKKCDEYITILRKQGQAAAGLLRQTQCYWDGGNPVVCCPKPVALTSTPKPPATTYEPLYQPYCGFSNASHGRVVGGVDAELGAFPWIAVLGYKNAKRPNEPKWLCGGSLITARHIITAGHCVFNRYDLYLARLGEHNIRSDDDGANPIDVPIQKGIIHPGYSNISHVNDIAILRLKNEVTFSPAIHPICLPLPPAVKDRDYTGTNPFVAGWGSVFFRGPPANVLQEVQLPVVPLSSCVERYKPFKQQVIDKRVMCAGYLDVGGRDACQGDSGGPMMFPQGYTYYIIGVVSFGFRCAEPGFPGVYTRVTEFLDFIQANLK